MKTSIVYAVHLGTDPIIYVRCLRALADVTFVA